MNKAYCNNCLELVSAEPIERNNCIYLSKDCSDCGNTETLISSDARRYWQKRNLDTGFDYRDCNLSCLECQHDKEPNIVFLDITNRCNLNCSICINNTPSMGYLFEPSIEYFDKIFQSLAQMSPKPSVQLFGGEPTVRKDLIEIIQRARQNKLSVRVVTNGINLADKEYCRKLVDNRATILVAFDGQKEETYRVLRGSSKMLEDKVQALDNLAQLDKAKVTLMTLVGRGFNDDEFKSMFQFAHDRRNVIRAIYFMPLAQTWDTDEFDLEPETTTSEDIEELVDDAYPEEDIDFLPAGLLGQLKSFMYCLKMKTVPFMGAHPNCESMYLMISDGEQYVPLSRYMKRSILDSARDLMDLEKRLQHHCNKQDEEHTPFQRKILRMRALMGVAGIFTRNVHLRSILKGKGLSKIYHGTAALTSFLVNRHTRDILSRHLNINEVLQIIVLPFEDRSNIETERMERCPASFAYYDPDKEEVCHVPVCAWSLHKDTVMEKIADYYNVNNKDKGEN